MNGIYFGGYGFSEPQVMPLSPMFGDCLADQGGLYTILVFDAKSTPRPYRPLYFGESDGICTRATGTHEKYLSWLEEVGTFSTLYRALCFLPMWTRSQRQQAESALIAEYNPPCNERLSAALDW